MPAPAEAPAAAGRTPLAFCAAAAVALTMVRLPAVEGSNLHLLTQYLLHPESLGSSVLVTASLAAPYTVGPLFVSKVLAALAGGLGVSGTLAVGTLQIALWAACAAAMARLALTATEDQTAAGLAVLFFGSNMPLGLADAPYTLVTIDRCLGLLPLLLSVTALLRGRRWAALGWLGAATYLHPNPAIFVWPLVLLEDALAAWRDPKAARAFFSRAAAAVLIGLPMLLWSGGNPFKELDRAYAEMTLSVLGPWLGGTDIKAADWALVLEGYALIAFAFWEGRNLPSAGLWRRAAALSVVFVVCGSWAFRHPAPDSALWGVVIKLQPWIALYLPELAGDLLVPLLAARALRRDPVLGLPLLAALVESAIYRDFVTRFWAVLLLGALAGGTPAVPGFAGAIGAPGLAGEKRRLALGIVVGAALLPFLHAAVPAQFQAAAAAAGLRGGLFELPAFAPWAGGVLLLLLAAGAALRRQDRLREHAALAAAALLLAAACWGRRETRDGAMARMADWVRGNTEASAVVVQSPLTLTRCLDFMPRSERALFTCPEFLNLGFNYCPASRAMAEHLRAAGFEPGRVRGQDTLPAELERSDAWLEGENLAALARGRGVGYLLTSRPREVSGAVVHAEGPYTLYKLAP